MNISKMSLNFLTLLAFLSISFGLYGQQRVFDVPLWQEGLPNSNGHDGGDYAMDDKNYKPAMRVFLPAKEKATGRAIVCYPGGGYSQTSPERYAQTWAPFYNELGIAFVALHYRMPYANPEIPISDALEAFRQTRLHAKEWNINPEDIGMQGVSAGGHLASTIATQYQDTVKASFQILIYPVISFQEGYVHQGSRDNFIGKAPAKGANDDAKLLADCSQEEHRYKALQQQYSNQMNVTNKTPKAFIAVSNDDKLADNSVLYYLALHGNKVSAVLHVYASGGHGWHINEKNRSKPFAHSALVEEELKEWLSSF